MMRARIPTLGLRRSFVLGQSDVPAALPSNTVTLAIVVTDVKGDPFRDATVTARLRSGILDSRKTDAEGVALFTTPPVSEPLSIRVESGALVAERKIPADSVNAGETLFVQLPVDRPEAILTPLEIGTLLLGGAAMAGGTYYKVDPLKLAGEILLGAGIFTAIYRHGC